MNGLLPLHVAIYPEEGWWVAHVLELNVVTQGKTPKHAEEMAVDATRLALEIRLRPHPVPRDLWQQLLPSKPYPHHWPRHALAHFMTPAYQFIRTKPPLAWMTWC